MQYFESQDRDFQHAGINYLPFSLTNTFTLEDFLANMNVRYMLLSVCVAQLAERWSLAGKLTLFNKK